MSDTRLFNDFAEPGSYTATVSGSPVLAMTYQRDDLGRIAGKTETIEGVATAFEYGYDTAGRLTEVTRTPDGGAPLVATYSYDPNGNRLAKTNNLGTVEGAYDDQDRLRFGCLVRPC